MTKQPAKTEPFLTKGYKRLLKEIKDKVLSSQFKAAVAVNSELIKLYWEIGNTVSELLATLVASSSLKHS